jgi:hypothetical protein
LHIAIKELSLTMGRGILLLFWTYTEETGTSKILIRYSSEECLCSKQGVW